MDADWPMIGVRFALYLVLSVLFGLSAFGLYGVRATERGVLALRPWLLASAGLGLLLSCASLVLMTDAMAGASPGTVDRAAIGAVLTGSATGTAWLGRMAALAVAVGAALFARRAIGLAIVTICSGGALTTLAWTGHGAMDDGVIGWVHLLADIVHLIAAGTWVGALLGLVLLVSRPIALVDAAHLGLTHRALHGFGKIGTLVVGVTVVTGLINGWLLVGPAQVAHLGATPYGQLLLAKLALFAAMLALAGLNRFRLTPALKTSTAARDFACSLHALRASLAVEAACVVSILGLVGRLGTLDPPGIGA